jgi:hypothetical protein
MDVVTVQAKPMRSGREKHTGMRKAGFAIKMIRRTVSQTLERTADSLVSAKTRFAATIAPPFKSASQLCGCS